MQTVQKAKKRYSLFTNKQLLWLIAPIVIESIFSTSLGMFDSIMVSTIDAAGHASNAVSNVDFINNLIIQLFSAFATGGAIITSQYLGGRDGENARKSAKHMLVLVLLFSLLIAAVCLALNYPLLKLFYPDVEGSLMELQRQYFYITAASFPFIGIFNGSAALLRAQRRSMVTMVSAGISCVVNIALNALFIMVLQMGVSGAALATLIARAIPAIYMRVLLMSDKNVLTVKLFEKFKPDIKMVKHILFIAIPSGIESCLFQLGKLMTNTFVNAGCYIHYDSAIGENINIQANANTAANNLNNIASVVGSGVGTSCLTVIGQAVGTGDVDCVKYYIKRMFVISFIANAVAVALIMGTCQWLIYMWDYPADAYPIAIKCLYLCLAFQFVTYPLSFTTPAILKATSDVRYVMWSAISSMIVMRVGLCFLLADDALTPWLLSTFGFKFELGAMGYWIAMCADWCMRSILFVSRLLTGRWKKASGMFKDNDASRLVSEEEGEKDDAHNEQGARNEQEGEIAQFAEGGDVLQSEDGDKAVQAAGDTVRNTKIEQ